MGACLSCLGLGDPSSSDEPPSEADRLLYSPTASASYGAITQQSAPAVDPEELRRHHQKLERICADTANDLLDVQHAHHLMTLHGRPSAEFARLLNDHFTDPAAPNTPTPEDAAEPPKTPVAAQAVASPTEPPSPFTQAQLAVRNGKPVKATFATISETEQADGEQTAEDSWLERMGWRPNEGVKKPKGALVMDLKSDEGR